MSLRTTFFAVTYDRQMAKTERAGLRALRERLLTGAGAGPAGRARRRPRAWTTAQAGLVGVYFPGLLAAMA